MKVLTIDCETSPHNLLGFGLKNQFFSLNQIVKPGQMISWAAKWVDKPAVTFMSNYHNGHADMVEGAFKLLSEADAVVTYNGDKFDLRWFQTEFTKAGLGEPEPFRSIDLYKIARRKLYLPSYKLEYVASWLEVGHKLSHTGFQLWVDCLNGDKAAWNLMRRYNKQDVVVTEAVYHKLASLSTAGVVGTLYVDADSPTCPNPDCGGSNVIRQGYKYTTLGKYQQYQCRDCGRWSRGKKAVQLAGVR